MIIIIYNANYQVYVIVIKLDIIVIKVCSAKVKIHI